MTETFKCVEKRYSLVFFLRWFDKNSTWLLNSTMDKLCLLFYNINEYIGLVNSG